MPVQLHTSRLVLKPYLPSDTEDLFHMVRANEENITVAFPKLLAATRTLPGTEQYILLRQKELNEKQTYAFGIRLKENGLLAGHIVVKSIDRSVPKCELSYFIAKEQQRKGYVTEAVKCILGFCFDELHMRKVFLRIAPGNISSLLVAQKCGFRKEGLLKEEFRTGDDRLIDLLYLGLTASEHREKK